MKDMDLFQLGLGLATGAQEEDTARGVTPANVNAAAEVFDDSRDDHFIRRDGDVFAGTHLIIEVVNGDGLDDETRIHAAFRDCVTECGATLSPGARSTCLRRPSARKMCACGNCAGAAG